MNNEVWVVAQLRDGGIAPGELSEAAIAGALGKYPGASAASLQQGRQLFLDNCENCHAYADLWFYDAEKWPDIMKKMGKEAELTQQESDLVLHFVLTAKADPRPPDAPPSGTPKKKSR